MLIIVVTYNGKRDIERCLASCDAADPDVECMVIDNGSSDGTLDIVRERFPHVGVVESRRNLGFGGANNIGIRYALDKGFDYVYLLNQDAWIESDALQRLIGIAERHPGFGILSPMQMWADGETCDPPFASQFSEEFKEIVGAGLTPVKKEVYPVKPHGMVQGAHWLLRCEAARKAGIFSPVFFMYGEDNNLCHRMVFHGYSVGIAPSIKAVHNRGGRIEPAKTRRYKSLQMLKFHVLDPNLSTAEKKVQLRRDLARAWSRHKGKMLPYFFRFAFSLPMLMWHYSKSRKTGAYI